MRDEYEAELSGTQKVTKGDFIELYAKAHVGALTKANILAAFSKTGVVPFNPDVITNVMMAPSVDTSVAVNNPLPLLMDDAAQALADFLEAEFLKAKQLRAGPVERNNQDLEANENMVIENTNMRSRSNSGASVSSQDCSATREAHQIVGTIMNSSSAYLLHSSPLRSDQPPPMFMPQPFSPTKNRYEALLLEPAMTEREQSLMDMLYEAAGREQAQKSFLMGMQATTVLQGLFVKKARAQIQAQEEKARKRRRTGRLHADRKPRLLSNPLFVQQVVDENNEKAAKAAEKADRQARRQQHSESLCDWKRAEKLRKERNQDRRERFQLLVASWNEAREQAKAEKRKFTVPKPKCQGIEAPIPRPKKQQTETESEDGEEDEQDDDTEIEQEED